MRTHNHQDGITLLITLIVMGVLLGVSTSLLNVTLKQFQLSGITLSSEVAFQAASAGMECALFYDHPGPSDPPGPFDVPGDGSTRAPATISCMEDSDTDSNPAGSGDQQEFQFDWGTAPNQVCTKIIVTKFYEDLGFDGDAVGPNVAIGGVTYRPLPCPEGSVCTIVQSRGYNVACTAIPTAGRVVEREYTQVY